MPSISFVKEREKKGIKTKRRDAFMSLDISQTQVRIIEETNIPQS